MIVFPFILRHGLTRAELASLVIFANEVDVSIETGGTDEGFAYAALDLGPRYGLPEGEAVWVISREQSRVIAYDDEDDLLLTFNSVDEILTVFRRLLPTAYSKAS